MVLSGEVKFLEMSKKWNCFACDMREFGAAVIGNDSYRRILSYLLRLFVSLLIFNLDCTVKVLFFDELVHLLINSFRFLESA